MVFKIFQKLRTSVKILLSFLLSLLAFHVEKNKICWKGIWTKYCGWLYCWWGMWAGEMWCVYLRLNLNENVDRQYRTVYCHCTRVPVPHQMGLFFASLCQSSDVSYYSIHPLLTKSLLWRLSSCSIHRCTFLMEENMQKVSEVIKHRLLLSDCEQHVSESYEFSGQRGYAFRKEMFKLKRRSFEPRLRYMTRCLTHVVL